MLLPTNYLLHIWSPIYLKWNIQSKFKQINVNTFILFTYRFKSHHHMHVNNEHSSLFAKLQTINFSYNRTNCVDNINVNTTHHQRDAWIHLCIPIVHIATSLQYSYTKKCSVPQVNILSDFSNFHWNCVSWYVCDRRESRRLNGRPYILSTS